jgi:uncharacterized membrane protein YeaQ/YmgE (transglycosylase-associated protein family)
MDLIVFLVVGLLAGWLAALFIRGRGLGVLGDVIVGIAGGLIGGYVFGALGLAAYGLFGAVIRATVGAVILLAIIKAVKKV